MLLLLTMISTALAAPQTPRVLGHLAFQAHLSPGFRLRPLGPPLCHPFQRPLALLLVRLEAEGMQAHQVG